MYFSMHDCGLLGSHDMGIGCPFEVGLRLVVSIEVCLWVRPCVVLLQVLLRDEKLLALLALVELRTLLGWQFEQVFVSAESLLFETKLFLEDCVLGLLLLDSFTDTHGFFMALLIVQIKGLCQRL